MNDPISARITPAGSSAIAVIRISGFKALEIVAGYFDNPDKLLKARSHSIVFGTFKDETGIPLDEVLISVFRAPHSYTGEDVAEINCHGNPLIAERILGVLLLKSRLANPGEFTLRAYLNSKLDLSRAEAVNDLIQAGSSKASMAALMQVKGYLSRHLESLLDELADARLRCELAIDFADQDLPQIDTNDLRRRILEIRQRACALYEEGSHARKLREGIRICLAGAPNAGKSSLFNAFLKQNRAIVTPQPGTTRDYLEESFSLEGYPVVLLDTAGIRESQDSIEREGIKRSLELMHGADIILYLYEEDAPDFPEELGNLQDKVIFAASKADMRPLAKLPQGHIPVSALSPDGLKLISKSILERMQMPDNILERPMVTNARHLAALQRSIAALDMALGALDMDAGFEFVASDLIQASSALEDILGVVPTEDLLGRIFENFCIGK
ncbi:MAG: tRNA uridine-5-carboxymethylaminomethyl(34) synthesis GTPase MnmE [Candidatus Cloacimonadaceae bacterium]|nr:tRNA uridine-5-carboxymethylaminomethyl(34) synthesis GTPase MnmE [Candidatus Cloacimonadaceae bacterium]